MDTQDDAYWNCFWNNTCKGVTYSTWYDCYWYASCPAVIEGEWFGFGEFNEYLSCVEEHDTTYCAPIDVKGAYYDCYRYNNGCSGISEDST